jgi:hypothetical protein
MNDIHDIGITVPDDLVLLQPGGKACTFCDDMAWVTNPSPGTYTVEDGYSTFLRDRVLHLTPSDCAPPIGDGTEVCIPDSEFFFGWMAPGSKTVEISSLPAIDPNLRLIATGHVVQDTSNHPSNYKEPCAGMAVKVYNMADSCVTGFGGMTWQNYPDIYTTCDHVWVGVTDAEGVLEFALPYAGDFMAIGKYVASEPIYIGTSIGEVLLDGSLKVKHMKFVRNASKPDKPVPAKYRKEKGSELLIIEPEYVEWSEESELYPIILESVGDWSVTTSLEPPDSSPSPMLAPGGQKPR